MWLLLFGAVVLCLVYFCKPFRKSKHNLPPGPPKLPIIGSLLSFLLADAKRPYVAFGKLAKKYGNIISLQTGSIPTVVINGYEKINQIAHSEHPMSRVDERDLWLTVKTNSIPLGLVFSFPEFWVPTKAYTHKIWKKYGFNEKTKMSAIVVEEFLQFCEGVSEQMINGKATIRITDQFDICFFSIIWAMLTGAKCDRNDSKTKQNLDALNAYMKSGKYGGSVVHIYPELVSIFPKLTGFQSLREVCAKWREIIQVILIEERRKLAHNDEPVNFIQEFLQEVDKTDRPSNLLSTIFTEENVVGVIQDMFLGGTTTVSHSINFFIRYLLHYPHVQDKLSLEVDTVVGRNRNVTTDDIPQLLYTQACLNELHRLSSIGTLAPRKVLEDWKLDNYVIPKGTLLILNLLSANLDNTVWEKPTTFDPERFISSNEKLINTDKIFSFGFGKRRCIGEQFGKTSLILAVTTLIQRFKFEIDPVAGPPSDGDVLGLSRDTEPYSVVIRSKH